MERKFKQLMATELVSRLAKESEATIKGTFEDFNPEYSEQIIQEIENIYEYDCATAGDLIKIIDVEDRLMNVLLYQGA